MKVKLSLAMTLALSISGTHAWAQDMKPYKEGAVTELSYIKLKPGKLDDYMNFLRGPYKSMMEEYKKQGIITAYAVYATRPRSANEPDLILSITYPNMGALDKIEEVEAIDAKVVGSRAEQIKQYGDRESMRVDMGSELIRELVLK